VNGVTEALRQIIRAGRPSRLWDGTHSWACLGNYAHAHNTLPI
jgi:hypothetical protein